MAKMRSSLQSVLNFRDVADFANTATGSERLQLGLLYRSARPDAASFNDRHTLLHDYGVKTIIDLRTKTEHIEQAQKRDASIKASAALPQSNEEVVQPLKIPGVTYHEINFNGSAFSRMLISKLSWVEFFKLAGLMTAGYRKDAIKILSPHMEEMGLVGLAKNSLDVCTHEIKKVFDVLADKSSWPVLIHCTQGKDRTGLVIMLVLFLLDVDGDVIDGDYRVSESELEPEKAERLQELGSIGLTEQFAICPPGVVSSVSEHIQTKYGGVEKYLRGAGVRSEDIAFIKRKLLRRVG